MSQRAMTYPQSTQVISTRPHMESSRRIRRSAGEFQGPLSPRPALERAPRPVPAYRRLSIQIPNLRSDIWISPQVPPLSWDAIPVYRRPMSVLEPVAKENHPGSVIITLRWNTIPSLERKCFSFRINEVFVKVKYIIIIKSRNAFKLNSIAMIGRVPKIKILGKIKRQV